MSVLVPAKKSNRRRLVGAAAGVGFALGFAVVIAAVIIATARVQSVEMVGYLVERSFGPSSATIATVAMAAEQGGSSASMSIGGGGLGLLIGLPAALAGIAWLITRQGNGVPS